MILSIEYLIFETNNRVGLLLNLSIEVKWFENFAQSQD